MQGTSQFGSNHQRRARREEIIRNFQPGQVIAGRYEVIGQIGAGAMGVVLRVRDRVLDNETVALKFLYRSSKDEVVFNRFRNEVLLTRNLTHQNIIRVHDFGESEGGHFFISMEYVAGYSLGALIKSLRPDTLPFEEVLRIIRAVASGVAYAHKKGVVHRDIKPDNVLLSHDGEIRVTDFGLARALHSSKNHTAAGQAVGTPYYMSPEQIQGLPLDPRCDIYSLGILAYEMVSGERPFTGSDWPTIAGKHLHDPLPKIAIRSRAVPAWFQDFIERCAAKKPADRYESMDTVIEFIEDKMGLNPAKPMSSGPRTKSSFTASLPAPHPTPPRAKARDEKSRRNDTKRGRAVTRAHSIDEAVLKSQFKTRSMLQEERQLTRRSGQQTVMVIVALLLVSACIASAFVVYLRRPLMSAPPPPVAAQQPAPPQKLPTVAEMLPDPPAAAANSAAATQAVRSSLARLRLRIKSQVQVGVRGGGGLLAGTPTNKLHLVEWSAKMRGMEEEERILGRDELRKNFKVQLLNPKTDVVVGELSARDVRLARISGDELVFSGNLGSLEAQVPSSGRYILKLSYAERVLSTETVLLEKASVSFSRPSTRQAGHSTVTY